MDKTILKQVNDFRKNEAISCQMADCSPEYIFRGLGGRIHYDDIVAALKELPKNPYDYVDPDLVK